MAIDRQQYLEHIIPYRLHAIDAFYLAVRYLQSGEHPKELTILFDNKKVIEGNSLAYINPVLETGVISCRLLLDFLGLKEDSRTDLKLRERAAKQKPGDVCLEDFSTSQVTLTPVTKKEALSRFTDPPDLTEKAFATVIKHANKVVAHLTEFLPTDPQTLELYAYASIGVPILVCQHLYVPLGLTPPDYQLGNRQRVPGE